MHHFAYRGGVLHAEGVALDALARAQGTPLYVYATATIERHHRLFAAALAPGAVHYAVKANASLGVLATLARLGAGADVVSEGEARKALLAGVPASRIVFSGVGKTDAELAFAVDAGLHQVNVETEDELRALSAIAASKGRRQPIALRVNPKVGAGGHAKITTGGEGDKFGVSFEEAARLYAEAGRLPGVEPLGLAVHIGSQITELSALEAAFVRMRGLVERLRGEGHRVERLDLGGGLGIPYDQDFHGGQRPGEAPSPLAGPGLIEAYAAMVARVTAGLDVALAYEPGRLIVGNAGVLLARVLRRNPRPGREIVVLDAAMNDLVRPAMYDAHHAIWPVREPPPGAPLAATDVVGPVCESGDTFARARPLPALAPGDLVAFMSAGAYGASMASTYNLRPLVPEAIVRGGEAALTRPRQDYEELVGRDRLPGWLAPRR